MKERIVQMFVSKGITPLTVESVTCVTRRASQLAVGGGMKETWVGLYHILSAGGERDGS